MTRRFEKRNGEGTDHLSMHHSWMLEWFLGFNPVGATHDYLPSLVDRDSPARNPVPIYTIPKE
jgi:hypothetical protein